MIFMLTQSCHGKKKRLPKKIESVLRELGYENIRRGFGGTGSGVTADLTGKEDGGDFLGDWAPPRNGAMATGSWVSPTPVT